MNKDNVIKEIRTNKKVVPSKEMLDVKAEFDFGEYGKCIATVVEVLPSSTTYQLPRDFDFSFWQEHSKNIEVKRDGKTHKDVLYI